jgi:hypothetical protein
VIGNKLEAKNPSKYSREAVNQDHASSRKFAISPGFTNVMLIAKRKGKKERENLGRTPAVPAAE